MNVKLSFAPVSQNPVDLVAVVLLALGLWAVVRRGRRDLARAG